jgi:hypothetical protein
MFVKSRFVAMYYLQARPEGSNRSIKINTYGVADIIVERHQALYPAQLPGPESDSVIASEVRE